MLQSPGESSEGHRRELFARKDEAVFKLDLSRHAVTLRSRSITFDQVLP
jgi:hypothetical protein